MTATDPTNTPDPGTPQGPMTPDPTPQPAHDHGSAGFCTGHAQAPDERTETVAARLAKYVLDADAEPLAAIEIESIRSGRCGPLLYGGPCWLMPGHVGPHHCYRDDIAAVVAKHHPASLSTLEVMLRAALDPEGFCPTCGAQGDEPCRYVAADSPELAGLTRVGAGQHPARAATKEPR